MNFPVAQSIHLTILGIILLFLVIAIIVGSSLNPHKPPEQAQDKQKKPAPLALELPETVKDIQEAVGKDPRGWRRDAARYDLSLDSRLIIPSFTFLFLVMSWLLTQRRFSWALWVGLAAGVCAVGTAAFDYAENWHIRALLASPIEEITQQIIDHTRLFSLSKWALSFITSGLLSTLLLWRKDWIAALGIYYALISLCGLLAAVAGLLGWLHGPALAKIIGGAFSFIGLGTLVMLVILTFFSQKFLQEA
jgi:hypothetical protein